MPTYEYKCEKGHQILDERGVNDKPKYDVCPACQSKLVRVYSAMFNPERIGDWT